MPSFSSALPSLKTMDDLSALLKLCEFGLKRYCLRSASFYHCFERSKKSGHLRRISAPAPELKRLQRQIKTEILDRVELHSACTGYRQGMSIVSNASIHVGQRCVLNMDIKDFFQSIKTARVAGLFVSLGYAEDIAVVLSKLCCFRNALPQGAPSSPVIANLICQKLDRRLYGLAQAKKMKYSRYCDDITISSSSRIQASMLEFIKRIIEEEGFSINEEKTRILSRKSCQTVTGLTVNDKVNIPRRKRRLIRAVFHQAESYPGKAERYKSYLQGLSSYLHMVKQAGRLPLFCQRRKKQAAVQSAH